MLICPEDSKASYDYKLHQIICPYSDSDQPQFIWSENLSGTGGTCVTCPEKSTYIKDGDCKCSEELNKIYDANSNECVCMENHRPNSAGDKCVECANKPITAYDAKFEAEEFIDNKCKNCPKYSISAIDQEKSICYCDKEHIFWNEKCVMCPPHAKIETNGYDACICSNLETWLISTPYSSSLNLSSFSAIV